MDPITAAITVAGLGMSLFGTAKSASLAGQEAGVSQNITALQEQENSQRQLAMQISARRSSMQAVRQTQMAQAAGLSAGVNQGAQFSSGVSGGYAQAAGQGGVNLLGTSQNLQIGNQLFGIQSQVSQDQIQMSQLQSQGATAQGISAIGGSLAGSAGPLGKILGNFFGNSNDPASNEGGSYNSTNNFQNASGGSGGGV